MAKYSVVFMFTKKGNLLDYFTDKVSFDRVASREQYESWHNYYAREREVQLLAMFRWEKGKCFCRIKCPINPLPVKGEFETPGTTTPVLDFLKANGWEFKQKIHPNMFE